MPAGIVALVVFFFFGAAMSGLSAAALLMPNAIVDALWSLNPEAQRNLQAMGPWGPVLMLSVCGVCSLSAIGLLRQAAWGHRLAIVVLAINVTADLGNALVRGDVRTLIGLPIGGALIAYLVSPKVRQWYRPRARV